MRPLIAGGVFLMSGLLQTGAAAAHDVWLERAEEGYRLHYGHFGHAHGHADTSPPVLAAGAIEAYRAFDVAGREVPASRSDGHPRLFETEGVALIATITTGTWTKTPRGTVPLPRDEAEQPIRSWRSVEHVKRIDAWSEAFAEPLGEALDIVPLEDPWSRSPGDKLRLRVVRGGEPVAGATVAYDGKPRGTTDAEGRINVRLRTTGLQRIQAEHRTPLDSPQVDELLETATLCFDLAEAR